MTIAVEKQRQANPANRLTRRLSRPVLKLARPVLSLIKHEHFRAALLILLALSLFYGDVVFGGHTFLMENMTAGTIVSTSAYGYPGPPVVPGVTIPPVKDPGAIGWTIEPYSRYIPSILKAGELPLWNAAAGLGQPLMADGNSAAVEPLRMLLYFVPERWWALSIDMEVLIRFFMAGFFTYLFVRLLGLGFLPGLLAGFSLMLCSYLVGYGNHPQMKADTLAPLVLYSYERLVRQKRVVVFSLCAVATAWIILAAMPEAGFLALALAGLWYLYRSFWLWQESRFNWRVLARLTVNLALGIGLGLALAAFFILPMLENIATALSIHERASGLGALPAILTLSSLMPDAIPLSWQPHFYLGAIFLGVLGVLAAFRLKAQGRGAFFFAAFGLIFYLKLYNIGPTELIGYLPGFNQILLLKYPNLVISLSFSILAAYGLQLIQLRKAPVWAIGLALLLPAVLIGAVTFVNQDNAGIIKTGLSRDVQIAVCLGVALVGVWLLTWRLKSRAYYAVMVLVLLAFLEPVIWHWGTVRPLRYDSYTTPPFVNYLQRDKSLYRIFAVNQILYPETATAYKLNDIRYMVALASKRRFFFMNEFIEPGEAIAATMLKPGEVLSDQSMSRISEAIYTPGNPNAGEVIDHLSRFTGTESLLYYSKFFDLLGTKYMVVPKGYAYDNYVALLNMVDFVSKAKQPPKIYVAAPTFAGSSRNTIVMQPGANLTGSLTLPTGRLSLHFGVGRDPELCKASATKVPGLNYQVRLTDAKGEQTIFNQNLALSTQAKDCGWQDFSLDLSAWSGQRVTLAFVTAVDTTSTAPAAAAIPAYWSSPYIYYENVANAWLNAPTNPDKVSLNQPLFKANLADVNFYPALITIAKEKKPSIFMHAPNRAELPLKLPATNPHLSFAVGLDPLVWDAVKTVGDGVTFQVLVKAGDSETQIYKRYIDPKHNKADQIWLDEDLDLSAWQGQAVSLVFTTDGGPKGDTSGDWAHWGNIQLSGPEASRLNPAVSHFEMIYDKEVQIYRNNYAYPRAFVVHNLQLAPDLSTAMQKLAQADFNPATQAVIEGALPPGWDKALLDPINNQPPSPAQIIANTASTLEVQTAPTRPGLLLVSSSYNAGWKAYVDGVASPVVPVDVALSGVYLTAGPHQVKLVYAPDSFLLGGAITLLTGLGLLGWAGFTWLRKRGKTRPALTEAKLYQEEANKN